MSCWVSWSFQAILSTPCCCFRPVLQHISPGAAENRAQGREWLAQVDDKGHGGYRFTVQPQSVRRLFPESKQDLPTNLVPVVQTNPLLFPGHREGLVSPQLRNMIAGHSFMRRRPGGRLTPSQSHSFNKRRSLRRPSSGSIQDDIPQGNLNPAWNVSGSPVPGRQSASPTRFAPTPQVSPKQ
jgi:hypothetical protein